MHIIFRMAFRRLTNFFLLWYGKPTIHAKWKKTKVNLIWKRAL